MRKLELRGKWVLVTGASSGLGQEMARQLAVKYSANLIIAARRKDKLEELKTELEQTGISVKVMTADLSVHDDVVRLIDDCLADGKLYGAILNAGITYFGRHSELPWEQAETIVKTNVSSVAYMTTRLVAHFEKTKAEGGVMIVSSMAALFPVPYQAIYSASKAFILAFANALSAEIQNPALSLTVYAPGGIATEMTEGKKFDDLKGWLMPVKQAAAEGLSAFIGRKHIHIPGFFNRVGNVFMNFLPRKFLTKNMGKVYYKALLKAEGV
ncbi:SDR family NAD(P)-dependent oxidoreductase [Mucilaginibacter terrenus]|uniref:SDR family NAD(P)-dependent oxidoreductase n=1 Tax=Mucilaginibacter terrenus TaxID=2482727 RepID=A0A3E2NUL4_9SPHI|nr:SDR family NAD(P)-dependent oxidoreductase [Mucilaginibacter terrenus]RFZ84692.1 SDR family NAD(P)-dependent oxidoreductase [Mucilaginibacter terrenus]